ncbi:MAG: hypothetical protein AUH78_18680 [Gemmatimonadetes bacterium 13_1_40CM_4_69_8]|nr:MAG: hypothetical protein AUH45_05650 [Gemmatimonadetes bacterium 13_1_40CM_69_22]OLC71134.1 MAG: hypothetical protein AUH78_18680 [Gemmatimonadetes bacterium 13_1_40CM_4_69_8]
MKSSTHKRIVLAGFGCAGVLAVLVVAALLSVPRFDSEDLAKPSRYSAGHAAAALDSLRTETLPALDGLRHDDRYVLRPRPRPRPPPLPRSGRDGAVAAVRVWRDPEIALERVPYGDTAPLGSAERRQWMATAQWAQADSLLEAATRPWGRVSAVLAALDSSDDPFLPVLDPLPVLSAARALLARARWDVEHGRPADADTAVRAAITVGRHLQDDLALPHVVLGARIEREAVHMLAAVYHNAGRFAQRDRADAYLARVDSNLAALRHGLSQIRAAGALADNAAALVGWARHDALPLAVRRELILAVAFGWAYSDPETRGGPGDGRKEALAQLAGAGLPAELAGIVRRGTAAFGYNLLRRLTVAWRYKTT